MAVGIKSVFMRALYAVTGYGSSYTRQLMTTQEQQMVSGKTSVLLRGWQGSFSL